MIATVIRRCAFLVLLLVSLCGIHAVEVEASQAPVPLEFWNRTLAVFRSANGFSSVQERVERAVERLERLPVEALSAPIVAKSATVGQMTGVLLHAGPHFLFGITPQDLDPDSGQSLAEAGQQAEQRLRDLFTARLESDRGEVLLRGLWISGLTTLGLLAVLITLWLVRRAVNRRLNVSWFSRLPKAFGFDVSGLALTIVTSVVRLPFIAAGLVAIYSWLVACLAAFPYSRPWAQALGSWLMEVALMMLQGVIGALPGLFIVAVIMVLTRMATRGLASFFTGVEQGHLHLGWMEPETARATRRIAVVLVWLFAITISYPYLPGSSSDAFKGMSVFAGLILTLGASGMVNQVMSGLLVVYSRSMRPGDIVQVGDVVGTVVDLGLLSTRVRTPRLEEVSIPNAVLVGSTVTNFSSHDGQGMVLHVSVTIGYDTPWRQVHALLILAASRTPGLRAEPEPFVVQKALDDFYVSYELRARLEREIDRFRVLSDLHARIQDAFNEHGVQIMSPHFEAQPAQTVVVPTGGWAPAPAKPM